MQKKLQSVLFKEVPVKIILAVHREGETYPTEISYRIEGSYSHIVRTISDLVEIGILESEIRGRRKVISFTDKGREVADRVIEILDGDFKEKDVSDKLEKVIEIESKVEEIYSEELKGRERISIEKARNIGKRLGPYKRELGKLEGDVESKRVDEVRSRIDELMELKNSLSE
ncbi:hypothetical protein [Methanonatronarchaeum sp. AMET6-2]|uniref:hypothetical protein n=1 Tax=Methanonatronarchaeum sp. AMET6-2 TaxID=2933293 RepID=UPI001223C7E0|nr:hypothetical protein [Methanonatronarchaeum sp. AMET6-2]RZN60721.1 MAG: hypothetical protein EF811_06220 [Methanonatronarchaeia archaeon]UOY09884.1 hypothetical protein MU439_06395 [Methanonatronarchaeum sp. AMET6-2]